MIRDFPLPDLGEGLTESEIVSWRVAVGDTVALNQIIADVETAKAVVELPSPFAGTVTALHAAEGDTVNVGEKIFSCDTGESGEEAPDAAPDDAREPTLVGYGAAVDRAPKRRARRTTSVGRVDEPVASKRSERPRSTPPVRKLANDRGVDLDGVEGSGPRGRIERGDVEAVAATEPQGSAKRDARSSDVEKRIPVRGVRKHTAEAMVSSAFTAPHVTEFLTVDVTATMELVRSIRSERDLGQHQVNLLAVVAKALCIAVSRTPEVNARWDGEANEIVQLASVNLGIAVATDRGLVVPNIVGAEQLTLLELGTALRELAETARAGRTRPGEMSAGTISITNVGVFGVDAGTPILNPGEAAILAIGQVRRQPWEYRGEIALREVMTLSLSFDHRVVDGAQGSRFLADIGRILRDPGLALTMN